MKKKVVDTGGPFYNDRERARAEGFKATVGGEEVTFEPAPLIEPHHEGFMFKVVEKSRGHIRFSKDGRFEYYELAGEVYCAPVGNAFDLTSGRRIGRWECSRRHWDLFEPQGVFS